MREAPRFGDESAVYAGTATDLAGQVQPRAVLFAREDRFVHQWLAVGIEGSEPLVDLLATADRFFGTRDGPSAEARDRLPSADDLPQRPVFVVTDEGVEVRE